MTKPGVSKRLVGIFYILVINSLINISGGFSQTATEAGNSRSERQFSWGAAADVNTKYIWRGVNYNDGLVLQPDLHASFGNFSGGIWSNLTLWDRNHLEKEREFDFYLDYSWALGNLEIDHSVILFTYPGRPDWPTTGEIYLGLSYPLGDFSLTTVVAADFLSYLGSLYFEHGIAYEKALGDHLTFASTAKVGWGNGKFNDAYIATFPTSLNVATLTAELAWSPGGALYLKPHFELSRTLGKNNIAYIGKYPWFAGVAAGFDL